MSWLAEQLHKIDSTLRIIIFNMPYYDEHFAIEYSNEFAISNGESLITQKEIDFSTHKIDPKFSHVNQSKTVNLLMDEMGIDAAHVVGHDRGAVILENLCINNPERVITYSRGSQVWDYVDPKWKNLAPKILIGPPHRIMTIYHQFRILFFAVMNLNKPIHLLSETFKINGRSSKRGSDIYDRYTHLKYKSQISYKNYFKKIQQSFLQGGIDNEVQNRINLKNTSIPIMQFQGEDEFKRASNGSLISDQPYFGKYNLFRNEIEDIYPSAEDQSSVPLKKEYISDMGLYKEIQLKVGATFDKFFLIPDAAHFNVIENPKACASAIYNFINIEFNLNSNI
jgi:pimeloyl-ACP methyl ester carboxylesterase